MNRFSGVLLIYVYIPVFTLFAILVGISPSIAYQSQRIEIPSSMNPVGSGARALGMGGAFIAVADDATAASWNPGGLIQLETPEVSIVGAYFYRYDDNTFGSNPEASGPQDVSKETINYLSTAYPFNLFNRNMIISVNYQNLYDFSRNWKYSVNQESENLQVYQDIDHTKEGGLSALGIAYCVQIFPEFSFGFTLNFWEDGIYPNGWEQTTKQEGTGKHFNDAFIFDSTSTEKYEFSGFNINLGILWNITNRFVFGAVLKTPFRAELKYTSSFNSETYYPDDSTVETSNPSPLDEDEKLNMPMSYGIGLSYRFSDKFTASADIYRTEWEDYVLTDFTGQEVSPITGKPVAESDISATTQVRLGIEHLLIANKYVVPLRGGIFYDPAPADGESDDFYGFSLGSGIAIGRFIFDLAYQYRFGNNVGTSIAENYNLSQDVKEHTAYASMIVHF